MEPIKFDDNCIMFAEDQPEYETLPVLKVEGDMGTFYTSCWKLSFWEKIKVVFTGKIFIMILGLQPPISLAIEKPYENQSQ